MKKIITLSLLIGLSIFISCQEEDAPPEDAFGFLSVALDVSINIEEVGGRSNAVIPLENFTVIIEEEDGDIFAQYARYGEVPDEIELPTGTYKVITHSNNDLPAAFDNPYYYGESDLFTIDRDETEVVSLTAELANMQVSVTYSENVINSFESYSTTVENTSGDVLVFDETEMRDGYFAVDPLSILTTLTYTKLDGEEVTVEYSASISDPQPKTHYRITVDAVVQNGRVAINIMLDDGVDEVDIGLGNGNNDNDNDGVTVAEGDCDDTDATVYPGAPEIANDGIDQDCDGSDFVEDEDNDGFTVAAGDCDDTDSSIYPGAPEITNDGIDQDCDGSDLIDADNDGVPFPEDCNDNDNTIYIGATEIPYDGIDQNCDGADLTDVDGDGVPFPADCNDNDPTIRPGAPELPYDGIDQDCNGSDLRDVDGDGVNWPLDCNDNNPFIYPGAFDIPNNGIDENCDGFDEESCGGIGEPPCP